MPDPTNPTPEHDAALDAALAGEPLPPAAPVEPEAPVPDTLDAALADPKAEPEPEPAKATEPEPAKPADPTPAEPVKAEPDATVEAEIKGLGLKEKAAGRMRELHAQAKELAPLKEALAAAGVTDLATLPDLVKRAKTAEEMVNLVVETGADAKQYTQALDYLAAANAAGNGNMQAAEQVWGYLMSELEVYAKLLGRDLPGVVDPLKDHADLQEEVDDGLITRARALELARVRAGEAQVKAKQAAQATAVQANTAQAEAIQRGKESLNALGAELLAADPESYAAKAPYLVADLKRIAIQFPPEQWATQGAIAYAKIKLPAKPVDPPGARHTVGAVRPTGPTPSLAAEYKTPQEALEAALDQP